MEALLTSTEKLCFKAEGVPYSPYLCPVLVFPVSTWIKAKARGRDTGSMSILWSILILRKEAHRHPGQLNALLAELRLHCSYATPTHHLLFCVHSTPKG